MAQYPYHTEATTEYMENYLEEFRCQKDIFSWFCVSKSTKKVLEALTKQLTFDKQEEQEYDTACNNFSTAAKPRCVDDELMPIGSYIAQHLVDQLDFNFVMLPLLNNFSDHISQLGNIQIASSELPDRVMLDIQLAYRQSNHHEAAFQFWRMNAQKDAFQYWELNGIHA